MRENYPNFLCMKCNAHICCLYFITSNPGILQSSLHSRTLLDELVGCIKCLEVPSPTNWDIDSILCPECSLNLLLSNSEQYSLKLHPSWSLLGHSLGLSMFAILSMAYRILLIILSYLPILALGFTN
jgi:hypothetical protein